MFGNQNGAIEALDLAKGSLKWTFATGGPIFSSPASALSNGETKIVVGSADGNVYCLDTKGKLAWKTATSAAVLGSPHIDGDVVYIGGSDHSFRALDLATGKERWAFSGLNGPVVSKPVVYKNAVVFGAWDTNLHALNKEDGRLQWK